MDTKEVADEFAKLCKAGKLEEAGDRFWADDVVSLEPTPGPMSECKGRAAVDKKGEWWTANNEVHSFKTEGPYVHGDQFALLFSIDVTPKAGEGAGQRMQMDEVGLYTVKNGKITEERFLY